MVPDKACKLPDPPPQNDSTASGHNPRTSLDPFFLHFVDADMTGDDLENFVENSRQYLQVVRYLAYISNRRADIGIP